VKVLNILNNYVALPLKSGVQPGFNFRQDNFHENLFDDIIVLIQPWYNFFANGHRYIFHCNISENENFSVLIKMQTKRSGQSKISSLIQTSGSKLD